MHRSDCGDLDRMAELFTEGVYEPVVEPTWELAGLPDGMRHHETGHHLGKLVATIER